MTNIDVISKSNCKIVDNFWNILKKNFNVNTPYNSYQILNYIYYLKLFNSEILKIFLYFLKID